MIDQTILLTKCYDKVDIVPRKALKLLDLCKHLARIQPKEVSFACKILLACLTISTQDLNEVF